MTRSSTGEVLHLLEVRLDAGHGRHAAAEAAEHERRPVPSGERLEVDLKATAVETCVRPVHADERICGRAET